MATRAILLGSITLCAACFSGAGGSPGSGGGGGGGAGPGTGGSESGSGGAPPAPDTIAIVGTVVDTAAVPIWDAVVEIDGQSTSVDSEGRFRLEIEPTSSEIMVWARSSYAVPQLGTIAPEAGVWEYVLPLTMTPALFAYGDDTYPAMADVPLAGGITARLEVTGVSGSHQLRYAILEASRSPGRLAPRDAESEALQSGAMLYADVIDDLGEPIDPDVAAIEVTYTGTPAMDDVEGAGPWGRWVLDEASGRWVAPEDVDRGTGSTFSIRRPGFTNVDRPFPTSCIKGRFVTPDGVCKGGRVSADSPGINSQDNAADDGGFCLTGAQGVSTRVTMGKAATTITMPTTPGTCADLDTCVDVGDIEVSAEACDGTEVPDPLGSCSSVQTAGGDTPESRIIQLGKSNGEFAITWNFYDIKDRIRVTYEGEELLDTGCMSNGTTQSLEYVGEETTITVAVEPNCEGDSGTAWDFSVTCP